MNFVVKKLPFYKIGIDRPLFHRVLLMHALQCFLFLRRQDHKFCNGTYGLSRNNVGHERRYSAGDSTKDEQTSGCIRHNLLRLKKIIRSYLNPLVGDYFST